MKTTTVSMKYETSILLDILRLAAALAVIYFHAHDQWFPQLISPFTIMSKIGHAGVIIFFVISGYVIAYTTERNNRGFLQYAIARLSRLYSVLIPALIITYLIELIVKFTDPALLQSYTRGNSLMRYLLSSLFLNEIWLYSAAPPINGPLWSISYEFWYYVLFGIFFFFKKNRFYWFLLLILGLLIGPKILLLLPVWIMGCVSFLKKGKTLSTRIALLLFGAFFLIFVGSIAFLPAKPYIIGFKPFYFSNQFLTDWLLGSIVAVLLWISSKMKLEFITAELVHKIRNVADYTFPLYLLHHPLLVLLRSISNVKEGSIIQMLLYVSISIFSSVVIGYFLERNRFLWNNMISSVAVYLKNRLNKTRFFNNVFVKGKNPRVDVS